MHYLIRYIAFLSTVLLLSSCSSEQIEVSRAAMPYTGERIPMNLHFKVGDAVIDDSTIETARIIVFNDKGQIVYNDVSEAQPQSGVYVAKAEAAPGFNNFYVLCNAPESLTSKLEALTTEADIETMGFNAVGISLPLPMYGKVLRVYVAAKSDGSDATVMVDNITTSYLPVKVTRMLAKLSFTAIKNIATPEDDFLVKELRIRVCRMPVTTTIGEGHVYTDAKWSSELTALGTGSLNTNGGYTIMGDVYTIPDGVDRVTFPDLYIPEHLLAVAADRSKATYLTVDATCQMKNGSTQVLHSTYQINIGEKPTESFNIRRNNHYKIYATITGMGAMGIFAEIQAMDEFNLAINWKPVDGLVIISDKIEDYDFVADTCKNVNIWSDYMAYSGILKTYHADKGYNDIVFKYGSLIAVHSDLKATTPLPFSIPTSASDLGDILWYPSIYGNPYSEISSWSDIPCVASGGAIPVDNSQIALGLGDPCKLAGLTPEQIFTEGIIDNGQWHMATPAEHEVWSRTANNEVNAHGYKSFHYIMAPNVKTRAVDGTLSATTNGGGQYWTTTLSSAFGFVSTSPTTANMSAQDPQQGFAVRCVRNVIPATTLDIMNSPSFSYQGNITTGVSVSLLSNIPYWTITLVDDPNDAQVGTSRDFGDFSFAPGDTNVRSASGSFSQGFPVYVKRKESVSPRTFRVCITGVGFNGVAKTGYITVIQSGYTLVGPPVFDPVINSEQRVPKAGGTYGLTINLQPTDVAIPAGDLIVVGYYHGTQICESTIAATSPNQYVYSGLSITIPPHTVPAPIGLEFKVFLKQGAVYGSHIGFHYAIQDN